MKRKRGLGIFGKVFLYILIFLFVVICIMTILFAQQFERVFEDGKKEVIVDNIRPLVELLVGKSPSEAAAIADGFHQRNVYLHFYIKTSDGEVIYEDPVSKPGPNEQTQDYSMREGLSLPNKEYPALMAYDLSNGMTLYVFSYIEGNAIQPALISRLAAALIVVLFISILISLILARSITNPIRTLAHITRKMSRLEDVTVPFSRNDEIGLLTNDIYKMYSSLRTEIERVKDIEERQRYFFSAASHELKTPIASTIVLLQGMLDNIGDYKDHPKYLRKCMEKMDMQGRLISEMLEIVRLSDKNLSLQSENILIKPVILNALYSCQALIDIKEITVEIDLPDSLEVYTDRNILSRVLSNIILNAIQNVPEKDIVRVWSEDNEGRVRLYILNAGYIDENILRFEPFITADEARNKDKGRSGLGLTIVRKGSELLGATFSLENASDGVLFWLELP